MKQTHLPPHHERTALRQWHGQVRTVGQDLQGATVVELHGEIDIATAQQTTLHLDVATARDAPLVVVDLRGVTFIDSTGLRPVCRAWCRAVDRGGNLTLVCTAPRILSTLRLAGLIPTITVTRSYTPIGRATATTQFPGSATVGRLQRISRHLVPGSTYQ